VTLCDECVEGGSHALGLDLGRDAWLTGPLEEDEADPPRERLLVALERSPRAIAVDDDGSRLEDVLHDACVVFES
jgi:hypothetical protein